VTQRRTPLPQQTVPIKRTAIKRTPPAWKQRDGITAPGEPRQKPIPKKRKGPPRRDGQFRDRKYLDWLKKRDCVVTRLRGFPIELVQKPHLHWKMRIVDPAHGPPAGLKVKGPDNEAIPLTRWYHEEQTRIGWDAFEAKYGIDRAKEADEFYAAYKIVMGRS
jgi:hypothetical protein